MAHETRYWSTGNTVGREKARPDGAVELAIFSVPRKRWVADPGLISHITGIGGDGDWTPITREEASEILARVVAGPTVLPLRVGVPLR